jgi:hypothetical protein
MGPVAGSSEHSNEPSGPIKCVDLSAYKFLNKDAVWRMVTGYETLTEYS